VLGAYWFVAWDCVLMPPATGALLARDRMQDFQELADEAFRDPGAPAYPVNCHKCHVTSECFRLHK
jgi:hypothetical protein